MSADHREVRPSKRPEAEPGPAVRPALDSSRVRHLVAAALAEDVGSGDVTTRALVPPQAMARGVFVAREGLVVCGLAFAREVFRALEPSLLWQEMARDGATAEVGATIAAVEGFAAPILTGERTALNFLQRLSGIATLTRRAVVEIAGTGATVLDTRKTTPTLRDVEKYAVAVGGGTNHRFGLDDAVLVKDNHVALCGGIREAVRRAAEAGLSPDSIEVEVDDLEGLREALECGVGWILLDNFTPEDVSRAVALAAGRARLEVSGGLQPGDLRRLALTGVDDLSVGRLTHSAAASDISLEMEPLT